MYAFYRKLYKSLQESLQIQWAIFSIILASCPKYILYIRKKISKKISKKYTYDLVINIKILL